MAISRRRTAPSCHGVCNHNCAAQPGRVRAAAAAGSDRAPASGFFHPRTAPGMVWRAHIEADDVAHLVDKQWIGGQFEGFRTVRLQAEGAPDALDAGGGNPARSRHPSRAPMSSALRHRLQVATITASTLVSLIERGTPGRGSSRRPSSRCAMNGLAICTPFAA